MRYVAALVVLLCLASCDSGSVGSPFSAGTGAVPVMEMYIHEDDYSSLLGNRFSNVRVPVTFLYRDQTKRGRIEPAGAGTRYHPRWSYRIRMNDANSIEGGLVDFAVNAQTLDHSLMRTALASELFRSAGFPVFFSTHTLLSINGRNEGLYLITEKIDEEFFHRRGISVEELVKVGFDSHFSFNVPNNPARSFEKEIPDDGNLNGLVDLLHALDTTAIDRTLEDLSRYLDIREYLRYHAVASVMKSPDNFRNNFYLYKISSDGPYQVLPWDFDLTFDPGAEIGFYGDNELIDRLLQNDSCFALYKAELKHVVEDLFTEERLFPVLDSLSSHLAIAYSLSPYHGGLGYSLQHEADELKLLIRERRESLLRDLPTFIN